MQTIIMKYTSSKNEKIELIQNKFSSLIGEKIYSYELAQIWSDEDSSWDNWMDVPLFLSIGDKIISISW